MDGLVAAAAVADQRPEACAAEKVKKGEGPETLVLVRTPDILATLSGAKRPGQWILGFAAESEDHLANAAAKLQKKQPRCGAGQRYPGRAGLRGPGQHPDARHRPGASAPIGPLPKDDLARAVVQWWGHRLEARRPVALVQPSQIAGSSQGRTSLGRPGDLAQAHGHDDDPARGPVHGLQVQPRVWPGPGRSGRRRLQDHLPRRRPPRRWVWRGPGAGKAPAGTRRPPVGSRSCPWTAAPAGPSAAHPAWPPWPGPPPGAAGWDRPSARSGLPGS